MIPEIGHYLLVLATIVALASSPVVLAGAHRGDGYYMGFWRAATPLVFGALLLSTLCLVYAFVTDDFSVLYVSNHSNSKLDTVYKVAALWGSHEGSMLFWILLMSLYTFVACLAGCDDQVFKARVQGIMLFMIAGFCIFTILTSNPFLRNLPMVPPEGRDLNPVLQDIGMIMHPPVLFMGYSGLALMFAAMTSLLLNGKWVGAAVKFVMTCTVVAWAFLTAGNALGSWWAYNELGWGGWWFWDPVENSSFIPWLFCTGLLHSLLQTERRGQLRRLSIILTLVGFAVCMLGTFIVRSGVVQSVHAFASDPNRGLALLALGIVFLLPAVLLYMFRNDSVCDQPEKEFSKFDAVMTSAVFLLVIAGVCVLVGTLYPLAYDLMGLGTLTVGAPYFNSFFAPMALIAAVIVGVAHLWNCRPVHWGIAAAVSAAASGAVLALTSPKEAVMTAAAVFAVAWIVSSAVLSFFGSRRLNPGALIAHVGIAVSIIGATGISQYEQEALTRMGPGLGRPLGDVIFVYTETRPVRTNSYFGDQAQIEVLRAGDESLITVLRPERQTFNANGMNMSAAGIDHGVLRDLYVSMGNKLGPDEWLVRLTIKPLAGWIWAGACVMIFGGLLALARRRRRIANPE